MKRDRPSLGMNQTPHSDMTQASKSFGFLAFGPRTTQGRNVPSWMYVLSRRHGDLGEALYVKLDDWLFERGWIRTQVPGKTGYPTKTYISRVVPIEPAGLLYHATRRESLASIFSRGLYPGATDSRNSPGRLDSVDKTYFATSLGDEGGSASLKKGTARWWANHFASQSDVFGADWSIVAVDPAAISDLIFRDPWSTTGVAIRNKMPIPPDAITLVDE